MQDSRPLFRIPLGWILAFIFVWNHSIFAQQAFAPSESYERRVRNQGLVRELSLRGAVELALRNNLEIALERYTEQLNHWRIQGLLGYYDPSLRFASTLMGTASPTTSVLHTGVGLAKETTGDSIFNPSYLRNLPGGGSINVGIMTDRSTSNNLFTFVNPIYGTNLDFTWNQPLWRGFRDTQTDRMLKNARLDQQISDSVFRQRVASIIQRVQGQYWELVSAIETYETIRATRDLAVKQYENTKERLDAGLETKFGLSAARTEVAIREQSMIQAEVVISSVQNSLKRMVASGPEDTIWITSLLPRERPATKDVTIALDDAIDSALSHRSELEQIRLQLDQAGVDRKFLQRETKPTIDIRTNFGSMGRAGTTYDTETGQVVGGIPVPGGRIPDPKHPLAGGAATALGQLFGFSYRNWNVGVNAQMPLGGNRAAISQLKQTDVNEQRLRTMARSAQLDIMVEVRNAYEVVTTQKKAIAAARAARELSEEQLAGETERFGAGLSTNFEVLRYQRDVGDARLRELRATIDYEIAMTALQKAMDVIVNQGDLVIARNR